MRAVLTLVGISDNLKLNKLMTNKLPVVGEKYKATDLNEFIPNKDFILTCDEILDDRIILNKEKDGSHIGFPKDDFFKYFNKIKFDKKEIKRLKAELEGLRFYANMLEASFDSLQREKLIK